MKGAGVAMTTLAAFTIVAWISMGGAGARALAWQKLPVVQAKALALESQKPMLVDFTAAWCGACKELDRETFSNLEVSREAQRFLAVKVDATNDEDPVVADTMSSLQVVGLPTVILFDSQGHELKRFTDFVDAPEFLAALRKVK
jgi:thiol:disulfide interchange protein DsbD